MNQLTNFLQPIVLLSLLLVLHFSGETYAQENSEIEIHSTKVAYLNCDKTRLNKRNTKFTGIDKIIKEMVVSQCRGKLEDRHKYSQLVVEQMYDKMRGFTGVKQFSEMWSSYVNRGRMLSLDTDTGVMGDPIKLRFIEDTLPIEDRGIFITFDPEESCKKVFVSDGSQPFPSCQKVSENLETSLDTLNFFRKDARYSKMAEHISLIESDWKSFMQESRFQTSLDVLVTTWMYSDKWKQADLQGPPPIQYFALHPTLVYSYMPDASRGEEAKPVPAIEWFGMNWWKNELPLGFSITSVYNDRPDGKEFPLGLTIHVDNTYSFGMVGKGDDKMFFFNIDVMEWFSDKKGKYDKYEKKFDTFRKDLKNI
jgi:hypothetical protein